MVPAAAAAPCCFWHAHPPTQAHIHPPCPSFSHCSLSQCSSKANSGGILPRSSARRYLLATHPEAEAKVAAELDAAGLLVTPARPAPRPLEYADLSKLQYLGWAIKVWIPEKNRPSSSRAFS